MLYNKERPMDFDSMVGQENIVRNIRNQSIKDKFFHIYILGGQFGSGKTTMARIIALASNCKSKDEKGNPCLECESCKSIINQTSMDVIEMDGASNTGVDDIRDLKETINYVPSNLKYKVYIIDEVHMLSKNAFNSLLKVLEEPPSYAIFILCTTETHAIPATVRSRAANYNFEQISYENIVNHLKNVSNKHSIKADDDALSLIAKNSFGALRNALSLLEQAAGDEVITADTINTMLGISDPSHIFKLIKLILKNDTSNCISQIEEISSMGKDLFILVSDMIDICADAVIAINAGVDAIENTNNYKDEIVGLTDSIKSDAICNVASMLMNIRQDLRKMPSKTTLIIGIINITRQVNIFSLDLLLDKIKELESKIESLELNINNNSIKATNSINNTGGLEETFIKTDEYTNLSHEDSFDKEPVNISVDIPINIPPEDVIDKKSSNMHNDTDISNHNQAKKSEKLEEIISPSDNHRPISNPIKNDKKDVTDKIKDNNPHIFDIFDIFGLSAVCESNTDKEETKENKMSFSCLPNDDKNTVISDEDKLNKLCLDEPTIDYSIKNACKKKIVDGKITFSTSEKAIYDLIKLYFEVNQINISLLLES